MSKSAVGEVRISRTMWRSPGSDLAGEHPRLEVLHAVERSPRAPSMSTPAIRTLSQASPSIRSSPPRPSMRSLPAPPRMMLPAPNEVTGPTRADHRADPAARRSGRCSRARCRKRRRRQSRSRSLSSPRRKSACAEPDRPSTEVKRARIDATRGRYRCLVEGAQGQVGGHAARIVLEDRPVETGEAFVAVAIAAVADHDVVAALTVHAVGQAFADEHVVAADRVEPERHRSCRRPRRRPCRPRSSRRLRCRTRTRWRARRE